MNKEFCSGVIEGFYGRPWLQSQRVQLYKHMKRWGMNTFMYAPKDDKKHRTAWRDLYDKDEIERLQLLISECNNNNIQFVYALAPGLDVTYSSTSDIRLLGEKYSQVGSLGCSSFAILFDDIANSMSKEDQSTFSSFAEAQCHVSNQAFAHLKSLLQDKMGRFFFCPTEYCGKMAKPSVETSPYLLTIGTMLNQSIDFFWTGPDIISTDIPIASILSLRSVIHRKPTIWDNLHANDYDMVRIYLGPYDCRSLELKEHLEGILTNPNCEYEANFVPFRTLAYYANEKKEYKPKEVLTKAIEEWFPFFKSAEKRNVMTLDDLALLCDLFYLPHQHGDRAQRYLRHFSFLLRESNQHEDFKKTYDAFMDTTKQIASLYTKMTEIDNRELLYALYGYVWEVKEESYVLAECAQWCLAGKKDNKFFSSEFRPKIYRGGFVRDLQRLIIMHEDGSFTPPSTSDTFMIRPASPSDELSMYHVCLKTGNGGDDGTPFYNDGNVLGRRWVGPYLFLQPDLAFVLEDDQGVCGYVLGALDTKSFYDVYQEKRTRKLIEMSRKTAYFFIFLKEWIPKMKLLYPTVPPAQPGKRDHDVIEWFHHPSFVFPDFFAPYPAHLHIDLLPRAQGKGMGMKMMGVLLNALKRRGAKGVFLEMSPHNSRALAFYTKLGFQKLHEDAQEDSLFLSKTL